LLESILKNDILETSGVMRVGGVAGASDLVDKMQGIAGEGESATVALIFIASQQRR